MTINEQFLRECAEEVAAQGADETLQDLTQAWIQRANAGKYSYHFTWMGRPIIQYPQDILAMQELIFAVQPDLIIETGIAHGGSVIFSASMLELNAACGGPADARVVGIDVDIRSHNRAAIEAHPMVKRIDMIEGSSIDPDVVARVREMARGKKRVLVSLDSNHTHDHVLAELEAYAPLTTKGSYCVVFDTIIENLPDGMWHNRPWGKGNNPMTAADDYVSRHPEFERDLAMDNKLLISVAPRGYLKRIA